eukprot:5600659-Lingulodinium_polyedra.AAC.1
MAALVGEVDCQERRVAWRGEYALVATPSIPWRQTRGVAPRSPQRQGPSPCPWPCGTFRGWCLHSRT